MVLLASGIVDEGPRFGAATVSTARVWVPVRQVAGGGCGTSVVVWDGWVWHTVGL
jgi:hypothetical protein